VIPDFTPYVVVLALALALLWASVRVLREYERAVVFTLGRFSGVRGPGLVLLVPLVQQMQRVGLRTNVLDVPSQDVISRDNVSVKVNAVVYFRVVDADRAVIEVDDFMGATSQLAQTTLRSVLGKHDLDEMLAERDKLNRDIQEILDSQTDAWGIKVANVEIKHVDIDESMVRAIARQAEAERNRRGRVIDAEGELQAAEKLTAAARVLAAVPEAMQLRYLSTAQLFTGERNSTVIFPLPIELLRGLGSLLPSARQRAEPAGPAGAAGPLFPSRPRPPAPGAGPRVMAAHALASRTRAAGVRGRWAGRDAQGRLAAALAGAAAHAHRAKRSGTAAHRTGRLGCIRYGSVHDPERMKPPQQIGRTPP
jgi:regulator of protease activity HflC (stomatin/prohibitin superfamily)